MKKISETLLIPLYAKVKEQEQLQPLLIDPIAPTLMQQIDYDFKKFDLSWYSLTGIVLRAAYFDAIVTRFIQRHTQPVVVHLGCGLDTRYQRLAANPHLSQQALEQAQFYQVDLTDVIALRQDLLPAVPNEHLIAASMFDPTWMQQVAKEQPQATYLFVIEGVLMYFTHWQNKRLFKELAQRFSGAEIHFDVLSRWLSQHTYLHDSVRFTRARFQFGVDNDALMERWHPHLSLQASVDLMRLDGWQRVGVLPWLGLPSMARLLAYYIK